MRASHPEDSGSGSGSRRQSWAEADIWRLLPSNSPDPVRGPRTVPAEKDSDPDHPGGLGEGDRAEAVKVHVEMTREEKEDDRRSEGEASDPRRAERPGTSLHRQSPEEHRRRPGHDV